MKRLLPLKGSERNERKARVRHIRNELKISIPKFSTSLGFSCYRLYPVINGEYGVSSEVAYAIEKHYGYSAKWILNGTGKKMVKDREKEVDDKVDSSVLEIMKVLSEA